MRLNHHALCKQKYARKSHLPFVNKTFSKEIMKTARQKYLELNFSMIELT